MKTISTLFILFLVCSSYAVVILQSTTATTIVKPVGATTQYSTYFNSISSGIAGPGVSWITSSIWARTIWYQNLFYTSCIGNANLTITAANGFYAYLDGVYIGGGFNSSMVFQFPIKITCGNHNLSVYVYDSNRATEGLTFAIDQDQSNCYNCQATGFWNEYTCQCLCIASQCQCASPRVWRPYPICGCGCPPIFRPPIINQATNKLLANASSTLTNQSTVTNTTASSKIDQAKTTSVVESSIILRRFCFYPRYYNIDTCSCTCHVTYCPPYQFYDQVNCRCYEIIP